VYDGTTDDMVKLIRDVIEAQDPDIIVLQHLDSSVFFARATDGSRMAPIKMADGKWHMVGAVTVCSQEMQFEHFAALKPVLDVIGKRRAIIIAPMPRYIVSGCCGDSSHCTGLGNPASRCAIEAALESLKKNLRDYLFNTGRRNIRVLDPMVEFRGMTDDELWNKEDPVHPLPDAYSKLADGVIRFKTMAEMKEANRPEDQKRRRTDSLDIVETGPGTGSRRNRGGELTFSNYTQGYRGNTNGWRGTPRSRGGNSRSYRGAAGGTSYSRRGGY
jgi:hypothetical protein